MCSLGRNYARRALSAANGVKLIPPVKEFGTTVTLIRRAQRAASVYLETLIALRARLIFGAGEGPRPRLKRFLPAKSGNEFGLLALMVPKLL